MQQTIIANAIVSSFDLLKAFPAFSHEWASENPREFHELLWQFGLNAALGVEVQENVPHRCLQGVVVECHRYVGKERIDKEWLESGFASYEAKQKASNSQLLTDLYRAKGLVE